MTKLAITMFAIAATFAGGASAEPLPGVATLAAPAQTARVAGEAGVWRCDGTSCTGMADSRTALAVAACTMVANANGTVASFSAGAQAFGEAELKRCNRHVR